MHAQSRQKRLEFIHTQRCAIHALDDLTNAALFIVCTLAAYQQPFEMHTSTAIITPPTPLPLSAPSTSAAATAALEQPSCRGREIQNGIEYSFDMKATDNSFIADNKFVATIFAIISLHQHSSQQWRQPLQQRARQQPWKRVAINIDRSRKTICSHRSARSFTVRWVDTGVTVKVSTLQCHFCTRSSAIHSQRACNDCVLGDVGSALERNGTVPCWPATKARRHYASNWQGRGCDTDQSTTTWNDRVARGTAVTAPGLTALHQPMHGKDFHRS